MYYIIYIDREIKYMFIYTSAMLGEYIPPQRTHLPSGSWISLYDRLFSSAQHSAAL